MGIGQGYTIDRKKKNVIETRIPKGECPIHYPMRSSECPKCYKLNKKDKKELTEKMTTRKEIIEKALINLFVVDIKGKMASTNNVMIFRDNFKKFLINFADSIEEKVKEEEEEHYKEMIDDLSKKFVMALKRIKLTKQNTLDKIKEDEFWKEGDTTYMIQGYHYPHDERCEDSMCWCVSRAKKENPEKWKKYREKNK